MRAQLTSLVLAVAFAYPAAAQEDGGTVSVLRQGAGGRSQGMGGAFTAISDDALGWISNPGGLGWITQGEGQIGQRTASDLDLTEIQAGFVYPRWQMGTFSIAYRQMRVSGIEGRDSRNAVTDTDLSDVESELTLGYGKAIGETWTVGVAAKLLRQSIAGRSGNAVGADLGFAVKPHRLFASAPRWADGLRAGLALHNVIQPGMRLDLDEVPDPRGANLGLAYERAVLGLPAVTWSLDIDLTEGRSARPRTGMEVRVHDQLDIRLGLRDTRFTAGTGIRKGRLSLDYSLEDDALTTRHRVGLSTRFGRTIEEVQRAAFKAQEDEVQRRITDTFQAKQSERISGLLQEANHLRSERNFDLALERTATIRVLSPENREVGAIEAACLKDQAESAESQGDLGEAAMFYQKALAASAGDSVAARGLARVVAMSEERSRRSDEVRGLYKRGLDLFAADDLQAARATFQRMVAIDSTDQEAEGMVERIDRAIHARVMALSSQAERLLNADLYADAAEVARTAAGLSPTSKSVARLRDLIRQRQSMEKGAGGSPGSKQDETQAARVRTPDEQREADNLYRRGLNADAKGRPEEAIRFIELARSLDPGHSGSISYLRRVYQTMGLDAFAAGRLEQAIEHWERALRADPGDQRTRAYLLRAQEHLARTRELENR